MNNSVVHVHRVNAEAVSACRASHSLNNLIGYVVVQTIIGGVRLVDIPGVSIVIGNEYEPNDYASAIEVARGLRSATPDNGVDSWAVVNTVWPCGCRY